MGKKRHHFFFSTSSKGCNKIEAWIIDGWVRPQYNTIIDESSEFELKCFDGTQESTSSFWNLDSLPYLASVAKTGPGEKKLFAYCSQQWPHR